MIFLAKITIICFDAQYNSYTNHMLSSFACNHSNSRGRLFLEQNIDHRNNFQRDRERIIHSNSFRRLEYKTQVFVNHEGDHYRTRLTHSLEVASNARSIARALGASEDLAESIALAHDLGHPPFGHAGEDALNTAMNSYGGFCHNAHAIKLLTKIERRYAAFDGLNLCWETLEGVAKHNGPIESPSKSLMEYDGIHNLELDKFSSIEAQIAAISDDISYHSHDIEDGIRAGMFDVESLRAIKILDKIISGIRTSEVDRLVYETVRELSHIMTGDIISNTQMNIQNTGIKSEFDVRNCGRQLVSLSHEMHDANQQIRAFLYKNMYLHEKMNSQRRESKLVVENLFAIYMEKPEMLPDSWRADITSEVSKAQVVGDYIAGMTDRYAMLCFKNINSSKS
jgi:dGTPase